VYDSALDADNCGTRFLLSGLVGSTNSADPVGGHMIGDTPRTDDRAVSKVVGVTLMVAIVVVLAATLGTIAMGFTDVLGPMPPQASFSFEYETGIDHTANPHISCSTGPCDEVVRITHAGGETFNGDRVTVRLEYTTTSGTRATKSATWSAIETDAVDASSRVLVVNDNGPPSLTDAEITLLWNSEDGQHSDVIATWEGPAA
jgi:FlaG/FlaF family flagellin (archaellin)